MTTQTQTQASDFPTKTMDVAKLAELLMIPGQITDVWTSDYDGTVTFEYAPTNSVQGQTVLDNEEYDANSAENALSDGWMHHKA